ncbi:hypothetical protein ZIOFF_052316 [Zingiber officinale]|uniref:Uncharacterized protein n=1 Tax=Zingiber officinale TaxID=94328 RepID=A0A8J5KSA9_ZINOF|nr:hypothetical protein ZIOFF_052316 [Zingiber officinale]
MPKTSSAPLPMLSMVTPLSQSIHILALQRDIVVRRNSREGHRFLVGEALCYSQSGHYEECLQLYREMEAGPDSILPNAAVEHDVKMDHAG